MATKEQISKIKHYYWEGMPIRKISKTVFKKEGCNAWYYIKKLDFKRRKIVRYTAENKE